MSSFKAKIGMKGPRKKEQQLSFRFVPTRRAIENSKKIEKKFKKLKTTTMASFQAKIRRETLINGENKNYRSFPFQPDG